MRGFVLGGCPEQWRSLLRLTDMRIGVGQAFVNTGSPTISRSVSTTVLSKVLDGRLGVESRHRSSCETWALTGPIVKGSRFLSVLVCTRSFRMQLVGVLVVIGKVVS